jgi:hypothetical protein
MILQEILQKRRILIDNDFKDTYSFSFKEFRKFCDNIEKLQNLIDSDEPDITIWETIINGTKIRDTLDTTANLTTFKVVKNIEEVSNANT